MPSFQQEESIFQAALQLASDDSRRSFLEAACGDDAQLRARIDALLRAYDSPDSDLQPIESETVLVPQVAEEVGTRIGPYTLREQLGEGGMGVVYVAEQKEPVRRLVALKIIKPGMDTRQVVSRFNAERQALAMMDHPNIAKVIDGGSTENGRPYFVMELIRGAPLTEYCDQLKMTVRERLELLATVCGAVQHAHLKGIIHRDLKPSNILVTEVDGKPVPKVIDFGVAKAISQQLTEQSIYTQFSQMIGTPLYMSPEQAGLSGVDIDTRSDVYSLGVVLYELLTGNTPFDRDDVRKSNYEEMRRMICEREPAKPSARVSTLKAEDGSTISERRRISPARLQQTIRGELDWIVMQALEKDRNRRYESASALAADIDRYLNNEPVLACPPSTSYRLKKFAARNRGLLATASLLLITLLTATAVSISYAFQAEAAREQADEQKDAAVASQQEADEQKEAALAAQRRAEENFRQARETVDTYLTKVSEDMLLNQPNMQSLREDLLGLALTYYQGFVDQHPDDPELEDELAASYLRLSELEAALGKFQESIERALKAVSIRENLLANDSSPDRKRLLAEGYLKLAEKYQSRQMFHEQLEYAEKAIAILDELTEEEQQSDPKRLEAMMVAIILKAEVISSSDSARSEQELRKAKKIAERLISIEPNNREFRSLLGLANNSLAHAVPTREKIPLYESTVEILKSLQKDSPDDQEAQFNLSIVLSNLASSYHDQGRASEAEILFHQALEVIDNLSAKNSAVIKYQRTRSSTNIQMAIFLVKTGDPIQAKPYFDKAIDIMERLVAEDPSYRHQLAMWYRYRTHYYKALATTEEGVSVLAHDMQRALERSPLSGRQFSDFVEFTKYVQRMYYEQSSELLDAAIKKNRRSANETGTSESNYLLAVFQAVLGAIQQRIGNADEAIESYLAAIDTLSGHEFGSHLMPVYLLASCQSELGALYSVRRQDEIARKLLKQGRANFESLAPNFPDARARILLELGRLYRRDGKSDEADKAFRKALALVEQYHSESLLKYRLYPNSLLYESSNRSFFMACLLTEIYVETGEMEKAQLRYAKANRKVDGRFDHYLDQFVETTETLGIDLVAKNRSVVPTRLIGSTIINSGGTIEIDGEKISNLLDLKTDDSEIVGIDLNGQLSTEFFAFAMLVDLPRLEWLDLSDTTLGYQAVKVLKSMPQLRRIDLSRVVVTEETLQTLGKEMPSVEIIWSEDERSHDVAEQVLESGWSLSVVDSRSSSLVMKNEDIPIHSFQVKEIKFGKGYSHTDEDLKKLAALQADAVDVLQLDGSVVTERGLNYVSNFQRLRRIILNNMHISGTSFFKRFPRLEFLALVGTEIDDADLRDIGKRKNLEYLMISGTVKISDSSFSHLSGLAGIEKLIVRVGRLTGEGLVHLKDLPVIHRLDLERNDLRNENLVHVSRITSLRELSLDRNPKLSDDCLEHFVSLKNLELLELEETQVTAEGVARLQEQLPDCEIRFTPRLHRKSDVESDEKTSLSRDAPSTQEETQAATQAARKVVEWAIESGGNAIIEDTLDQRKITLQEQIPNHSFLVTEIDILAGVNDEKLNALSQLPVSALTKIHLHCEGATANGMRQLFDFRDLRLLMLKDAPLKGLEFFKNFPKLDRLVLEAGVEIDERDLADIGQLKMLGQLLLEAEHISDDHLGHLVNLTRLFNLRFQNGKLTGQGLKHIKDLPRIRQLIARNLDLRDEYIAHISSMTALRTLDLKRNPKLTDDCLKYFEPLRDLSLLDVQETQITSEGVATLKKKLPGCEIRFLTRFPQIKILP